MALIYSNDALFSSPNEEDIDNNIHSHPPFLNPGSFNFSMAALTDPSLSGELWLQIYRRQLDISGNSGFTYALIRF